MNSARRIIYLVATFGMIFVLSLIQLQTAEAASSATCSNPPECAIDRSEGLAATPWFSPPGSSFYDYGSTFYFDETASSPTVEVVFRGSYFYNNPFKRVINVYSTSLYCNKKGQLCYNLNANGTNATGANAGSNRGVFASLDTSDYFRGTSSKATNLYYNSGSHWDRKGRIDLNSVSGFNKNSLRTQGLNVPIYSRIKWTGDLNGTGTGNWTSIPIKVIPGWVVKPSTKISQLTAKAGDTVTWTHTATKNASDSKNSVMVKLRGGSDAEGTKGSLDIAKNSLGASQSKSVNSSYVITSADMGKTICRYTTIGSYAWNVGTAWTGWKDEKCVKVDNDKWVVTPTTKIDKTTAKAGDVVTWTHTATNNAYNISTDIKLRGGSGSTTDVTKNIKKGTLGKSASTSASSSYAIKSTDVGKKICRYTQIDNYAWNALTSSTGWKDEKCVTVPYDYGLVPSVSGIPKTVEPGSGSKVSVTGNINNSGSTNSKGGDWQLTKIVYTRTPSNKASIDSGLGACSVSQYSANKKDCALVKSGTWAGPIPPAGNYNSDIKDEFTVGDEKVGTTVCYVLSIKPFKENTSGVSTGWRHSDLQCATYGKRPKVQVHGGDLIVGRSINGESPVKSKIETSVSTKRLSETITTPKKINITSSAGNTSSDVYGLWKTGVDSSGNKLGANINDPHWKISTIYNPKGLPTCVKGYDQSNNIRGASPASNIGNVDWQAVTVVESGGKAARRGGLRGHTMVGGHSLASATPEYMWNLINTGSRWVSFNQYAHDYSDASCVSPTYGSRNAQMDYGNTYVFTLKNPIYVSNDVDLSSLKLSIKGGADNLIKFYANGHELQPTSDSRMSTHANTTDWMEPGWSPTSFASATGKRRGTNTNALKHGNNTFEVRVVSNYSHTGLLISDFKVTGTKDVVETSVVNSTKTFGSWGEYGLIANGAVKGMASGAGLMGASDDPAQASWSKLTFANTFSTGSSTPCSSTSPWGCYTHPKSEAPNVDRLFTGGVALPAGNITTDVATLAHNKINRKSAGVINISGGVLSAGRHAVLIAPNSTVNISKNITYSTGALNSIKQIPQMIIIAKDINIDEGVTQVDSWLVAKNALSTCGLSAGLTKDTSLTSEQCNKQLYINGPVIANKLWLRRTAGADPGDATGEPAEIFRSRPDAALWLSQYLGEGALKTVNVKELPPRY